MRKWHTYPAAILLTLIISGIFPGQIQAWVGLELDAKSTGISNPYDATGTESSGSLWEFSGRLMYQENLDSLDLEIHWLGQAAYLDGDIVFPLTVQGSPFRYIDLETTHSLENDQAVYSEFDRLSLTWSTPGLVFTMGRQAVSWGEAFYFNIGDFFGAFPITETNRRYKPGIDAVNADFNLGSFSNLSLVVSPTRDGADNWAAHTNLPLGPGTFSITGGRIFEDYKTGAGYTIDISGTQVYGSLLLTDNNDGDEYSQAVMGAERQVGPYTLILGELYYNGWSTGDPDDYPALILSREYLTGNVLTLGKYSLALTLNRQVSPLLTMTPALFANLSDGSALVRIDGTWSISDLTDMAGGLFIGLGKRPDNGVPQSEYGAVPISIYVEVVHNI